MVKSTVCVKQTKKLTTSNKVVAQKGKTTVYSKREVSRKTFIKTAMETKGKCYMLSFNTPDSRSCKVNDIIANLVKNGYLLTVEPVLNNSILFTSPYNLSPINKFIHYEFPNLKFVLVRLNQKSFPVLKYCY